LQLGYNGFNNGRIHYSVRARRMTFNLKITREASEWQLHDLGFHALATA